MLKFYVCYLLICLLIYFGDNTTLRERAGFSNRVIQLLFILNIDSKRQSNTDNYLQIKPNRKIKQKLSELI